MSTSMFAGAYPENSNGLINGKIGMYYNNSVTKHNGYAIILGGGPNPFLWNDCARTYQYLEFAQGYKKDHIYSAFYTQEPLSGSISVPRDFDADGKSDINYELTKSNVTTMFNKVAANITANDEFFLFISAHGGDNCFAYNQSNTSCVFTYSDYLTKELNKIKAKHIYIVSNSCHGGSMIEYLKKGDVKRTIITSSSKAKNANAYGIGGVFLHHFLPASVGFNYNGDKLDKDSIDFNKDGKISIEEAFIYAKDHDENSKPSNKDKSWYEVPRYWTSESGYRFCRPDDWGVVNVTSTITKSGTKEAMYLLNASNVIKNNANVTYACGKTIHLKKGFHVVKGAKFKTEIFDCEAEKKANEAELRRLSFDEEYDEDITNSGDEVTGSQFVIAPNPTTGEFTIYFNEETEGGNSVVIMDLTGKVVFSANGLGSEASIDLGGKPQGMYIVQTIVNGTIQTAKLILE